MGKKTACPSLQARENTTHLLWHLLETENGLSSGAICKKTRVIFILNGFQQSAISRQQNNSQEDRERAETHPSKNTRSYKEVVEARGPRQIGLLKSISLSAFYALL